MRPPRVKSATPSRPIAGERRPKEHYERLRYFAKDAVRLEDYL